ncbi:MAG: hypothetical protein AAFY59_06730 [Pseudomonadota bacterium]
MTSLQKMLFRTAPLIALILASFSNTAAADVVTVSVPGSPVVLVGQLVEEDAGNVTIKTRYGMVVLAKSEIDCKGCAPQVFALAN